MPVQNIQMLCSRCHEWFTYLQMIEKDGIWMCKGCLS